MAMLGLLTMVLVIAVIAVAGVILIVFSRRGRRPYPSCGKCRYDVSGSIGTVDRCPECGQAFAEVGIMAPGGGKRAMALGATGVVLVVIAVGCMGTSIVATMYQRAENARMQAQFQAQVAAARAARQGQKQANTKPSGEEPATTNGGE